MATCQSLLLLKVASFGTFYKVSLPSFVAITEVMSQEGEWERELWFSRAQQQKLKLRMLVGSYYFKSTLFQDMCLNQKKNTVESVLGLFALLILPHCSCLAYQSEVAVEVLWLQLSERRALSWREQPKGFRSSLCKSASHSHLCCALLSSRDQMRCVDPGIIKTTEPAGSNRACWLQHSWNWGKDACSSSLTWLFSVSFLISLWGRQSGGSRAAGKKKGWQWLSIPHQGTIL